MEGCALDMSKQTIEQQVTDYLTEGFNAEDWNVDGIVDEIHGRGFESIDDMDADEFTKILEEHEL